MAELKLNRILHSEEYKKVSQNGVKIVAAGLILIFFKNTDISGHSANLGFVATKKIGNAVKRNKAKRRLKALSSEVMPQLAPPGFSYVMICRHTSAKRKFENLKKDLRYCLHQVKLHTKNEIFANSRNQNV